MVAPFGELSKVDVRVGRIVDAEEVSGSRRLVRLQVNLGGEVKQSVAALGEACGPDDLRGRLVAVLANLGPRRIFGLDSEVMALAAMEGPSTPPLQPDRAMPPGCKVA